MLLSLHIVSFLQSSARVSRLVQVLKLKEQKKIIDVYLPLSTWLRPFKTLFLLFFVQSSQIARSVIDNSNQTYGGAIHL